MDNSEDDSVREAVGLNLQANFWREVFSWFIHDLMGPLQGLAILKFRLRGAKETSSETSEYMHRISVPVGRIYAMAELAEDILRPPGEFDRESKKRSIALILSEIAQRYDYSWVREGFVVQMDEDLHTAPQVCTSAWWLERMISNLLLFSAAVSKGSQPTRISLGQNPGEVVLLIPVDKEQFCKADIERAWIPPEHLLQGRMPYLDSDNRGARFIGSFAAPMALLIAPWIPCRILYDLNSPDSLLITISFTEHSRTRQ
jgi:hypothetical protein